VTSQSTYHGWGDMITGPVFWLLFCHLTIAQFFLLSIMAMMGGLICLAFGIIIFSLSFWMDGARHHAENLLYWMISFMTTPVHGMPVVVKVFLFTVIPAGFISYLPVEMIRHPSPDKLIYMLMGVVAFLSLARFVFYRGLRRYTGVSALRGGV
jgi:ABC-2 type transport system permease protein